VLGGPEDFFEDANSISAEELREWFIEPLKKRFLLALQGHSGFATRHGFMGIGPEVVK